MLAREIVETLPDIKSKSNEDVDAVRWSDIVNEERELWPIHNLNWRCFDTVKQKANSKKQASMSCI